MYGHPLRKPFLVALSNLDIFGLHSAWWANRTFKALCLMECANDTECARDVSWWTGGVTLCSVYCVDGFWMACIGSVHKSVDLSLYPLNILLPLYIMSQYFSQKLTVHPASHSTRIPMSDAIVRLGTMCPVSTVGSPGIDMSQQCVDFTFVPSGRFMVNGFVATRLLSTGIPSMMKIAVAPVSRMTIDSAVSSFCGVVPNSVRAAVARDCGRTGWCVLFDVTIVTSSSSIVVTTLINLVGIGE